MWRNIWRNRIEFYPYLAMYLFVFLCVFFISLTIKSQPGAVGLGIVTIPSLILLTIATIKTYKELSRSNLKNEYDSIPDSKSSFDNKFKYIAYGLLIIIILFSTYLHVFQPQVLSVPDNAHVSTWKSPTLEQSVIYEHMTDVEKIKVMTEGVPLGKNWLIQFFMTDFWVILVGLLCYYNARKHYGAWMAHCFFVGSFVFTGLQESMLILFGRYFGGSFITPVGNIFYGTYWFTKGGFWFVETPMGACFAWFIVAYSCVLTAGKVFPKMSLVGRSAIGGLIAMGIDLWIDPVRTAVEQLGWVWAQGDFLVIFNIPAWNFLGWFLVIFTFAILWETLPKIEKKWGHAKGTVYFFVFCLAADVIVMGVILLGWIGVVGSIFSLAGVTQVIHIPIPRFW